MNVWERRNMTLKLYYGIFRGKGGTDQQGRDVLAAVDICQGDPATPKAIGVNNHGGITTFILASGIDSQYSQGIQQGFDGPFTKSIVTREGEDSPSQRYEAREKSHGGSIVSQVDFLPGVHNIAAGSSDDYIVPFDRDL
jgi:hypothetical protein